MKVLISDARYVNAETGQVTTPTVYHLIGFGCLEGSQHKLEVDEDMAKAFGRRPCKTCHGMQEKINQLREIQRILHENALPSLEGLTRLLPDEFELRLYHHSPNKKTPTKLWSSDLEV